MRASVLLRTPPARGHVPNLALGRPFLQRKCADCSDVPFGSALQRKVIMGASNDPLEREADRIAEGMVAVPTEASLHGASLPIQRAGRPAGQDAAAPASVDHALSGPGRPLWPVLRQVMEQRFRHDFSGVRVHADAAAMQSAREVNARAYTVGHHIVLGGDRFTPESPAGRRLIAHELTHVVQQSGAPRIGGGQGRGENAPASVASSMSLLQRDEKAEDQPKKASPCTATSLAATVKPTNTWGGKPWDPKLGEKEFGKTAKLGAMFEFGACKDKTDWRFYLKKLEVTITSKIQPEDFRINVPNANDSVVTNDKVSQIIEDLSPNATVTFHPECGADKFDDKVTNYSWRREYWNRKIVVDHEAFHAGDWEAKYRAELVKAEGQVWSHVIPAKDAANEAAAISKARTDLDSYMVSAYQQACKAYSPKQETRAYDDGAPKYQKLVDEIKARAIKEKWIVAPAPPPGKSPKKD